jgi:hypothetical protein
VRVRRSSEEGVVGMVGLGVQAKADECCVLIVRILNRFTKWEQDSICHRQRDVGHNSDSFKTLDFAQFAGLSQRLHSSLTSQPPHFLTLFPHCN